MEEFLQRLIGAARLDPDTYEDVEADPNATLQAGAVVALASLAAGIGSMHAFGPGGVVVGTISNLVAWVTQAIIIFYLGTTLLPEPQTDASIGELLRTIGFASAPGLIRILGVIPFLTVIVFTIATIWMLAAFVVAVRQALDYTSTGKAVLVCVVGLIVQIGVLWLVDGFAVRPAL